MRTKRFLSIVLTLAMLLGLFPGMNLTAYAEGNTTTITPSSTSGTMTITLKIKAAQTITVSDVTATYGDTDKSVSASVTTPSTGGGAISYAVKTGSEDYIGVDASTGALTIKKVPADGKAYVIVTAAATHDYAETTKEVTVTIRKAEATVTAKDQSIMIGGTVPDLSAPVLNTHYSVTGLVGTDALTTAPTLAYQKNGSVATPDSATAGTYDIVPSGAGAGDNYTIGYTKGTLTISEKQPATVTKAPEAKTLTYNGSAQELVIAGTATGGEMQYALGTETEATQPYTTSIPAKTDAGTYYVWYKAKGDDGYTDSEAAYVEAKINSPEPGKSSIKNDSTLPEAEKDKAYDVTFELEDSTITDLNWEVTKDSLPEGLSLDSKIGKLSGTPSKAGEYTFTIREKTSGAEKEFSLTVRSGEEPGPEPEPSAGIRNDSILPEAKQDADYDVTLELKDSSVQDTDWIVTDGSLPEGLSLDSRTGKISGKPAKEGEYEFTIKESKTGAEKKFNLTVTSSGSKKEEKRSSKHDTEEHKTASWILNPSEKQQLVITFTGTPAYLTAGYQEQGVAATELFKAAVPAGWSKAFSFNMLDQKRQPDVNVKNGTLTLSIPGEYINAGRQFALLGMNKAGQVILFADTDNNPNTVTVNLANMDGYAFNLIYRD